MTPVPLPARVGNVPRQVDHADRRRHVASTAAELVGTHGLDALTFRNVAYNTLTSRVPLPAERARFTSMQSAVQHLASAVASFLSAQMLRELPDRRLDGMPRVAALSTALTLVFPPLFWMIESSLFGRTRTQA